MSGTSGTTGPVSAELSSIVPEPGAGTTVKEAARMLGISERAVRKRLTAGRLSGSYDGRNWTVYLGEQVSGTAEPRPEPVPVSSGTPEPAVGTVPEPAELEALTHALQMIERLQAEAVRRERENMELAGRVGFLQAKLQDAEEKILALSPPVTLMPEPVRPPLWRRLLGLSPA